MKDFGMLSQRMDPEEMDGLMSRVFGRFESIVHSYEGSVEKYIGDALVAVFGAPSIHEDDPARAVNAALDLLDAVQRLNQELAPRETEIAFRIGVNTGLITTGKRGQYEVVTGHAMTVASRLESFAHSDSVLVSETTKNQCKDEFEFGEPLELKVKHTDQPVRAYPVRGRSHRPSLDDEVFVGREAIVDSITKRYLRHQPSQTDGVILLGEAGIGKTRIASRFVEQVRRFPNYQSPILFARAQRYRSRPFAVVTDLLADYFHLGADASREEVLQTVTECLDVEEKTAVACAELFAGEQPQMDNQAFVVLYLVLKSIVSAAGSSPFSVVIHVDNLRFIDPQSRDFFRFYLKNADSKPFFLLTNRPEGEPEEEVFDSLEKINVPPLTQAETRQLIELLWKEVPGETVVGSIQDAAQGNPLFVREYVRFAREKPRDQALPTTIQTIFLTSIDSLPSAERDLLKRLSVFAYSFTQSDAEYVQERTDGDPMIVTAALERLVANGTLVRDGRALMFRHDVFKQSLYDSLLNYNKRIIHRVISDLMRSKGSPHPIRLLHHLTRAEDYGAAFEALFESPNLVTNMEYLRYIDRLLEHVDQLDREAYIRLLFVKSAVLFNNGNSDQADSMQKDMLAAAISQRSTTFAANAYHLLTANNLQANAFDLVEYTGRKAITYYADAADASPRKQNVLEMMCSAAVLLGEHERAESLIEEIEALPRGDKPGIGNRVVTVRAEGCLMRGEYARARNYLMDHDEEAVEREDYKLTNLMLLSLANYHLCDWQELEHIDKMLLNTSSRHASNRAQVNAHMATASYFLSRDGGAAGAFLQQAQFNASQIRNDFDLVDAQRTVAEACAIVGDAERASRIAEEAVTVGQRHSASYSVFTLLLLLVELSWTRDDRDAARFYLTEASFLCARGHLLRNRDMLLYSYYQWRLADGASTRDKETALNLLELELQRIGDHSLVQAFLSTRRFATIARELGLTGDDASVAV